jgi:precorrin-6A/cobalt-precorrin-6A reductase
MAIWLIGGTAESKAIATHLLPHKIPLAITVTTPQARTLYPDHPLVRVHVGALTAAQMVAFLRDQQICGIVDASHPHAQAVSQQAIAAAQDLDLPYLRYERPSLAPVPDATVTPVPDWATLLAGDWWCDRRILFTIGYRYLADLAPWQSRGIFFVRILPSAVALDAAVQAGFTSDRIIALRPPIGLELETALWQQWGIEAVVTKASGRAGGEDVKRQVAQRLGIELIVIQRPALAYPRQTGNQDDILNFCNRCLSSPHHG